MDFIAKDAVSMLCREMVDGHVAYVRRPLPILSNDSDFMDIFSTDAERLEGITSPCLMRHDEWHDGVWTMKLAPGFISLYDALTKRPAALCAPKTVTAIVQALVNHLDYLHRHGLWMVHFTPHSILINLSTLQIKMLPPLSPYLDLRRNVFVGQPGAAPEASTPSTVSPRTDFYCLAQLLDKFRQFSPLPRSLNIILTSCSDEDPQQRLGGCTEIKRILERADKGNKAMPYVIGAAGFAILLAMFLFVGGEEEITSNDTRYIEPEKHQPSPEGVPDSINLMVEQYNHFIQDSLTIGEDEY